MKKTCLYFVRCKNLHYCLKLREWNEPCPSKCSLFSDTQHESALDDCFGRYNVECLRFTKKLDSNQDPRWFCRLTRVYDPYCASCSFCFSYLPSLSSFISSNSREKSHSIVVTRQSIIK
jgi:hypothetical protein